MLPHARAMVRSTCVCKYAHTHGDPLCSAAVCVLACIVTLVAAVQTMRNNHCCSACVSPRHDVEPHMCMPPHARAVVRSMGACKCAHTHGDPLCSAAVCVLACIVTLVAAVHA